MKQVKKTGAIVARSKGGPPLEEFLVDLEQFGGSDGTATAPATWRYHVRRFGMDKILFADLDPVQSPHKFRRQNLGSVTPADFGKAFLDYQGNLVVTWINESINFSTC